MCQLAINSRILSMLITTLRQAALRSDWEEYTARHHLREMASLTLFSLTSGRLPMMQDRHNIVITRDLNFHLDIVSQRDVRHFSETLTAHGMTRLVTYATHNKGHLLDVVIVRNHSAVVTSRPSVYDPCLSDTHGNPAGDNMAVKFCVNARKPV